MEGNHAIRLQGVDTTVAAEVVDRLVRDRVAERIWERDHRVWKPGPEEIVNRLGWLDSPARMGDGVAEMEGLAGELRREGFTHALLLGMGGSSLAPEVLRKTLGVAPGFLDLTVVDSTDPDFINYQRKTLASRKTCFIVSTKSGTTVETLSLFRYFFRETVRDAGEASAGRRFIAVTDPRSPLVDLAEKHRFRALFLNDPEIGGRFAALSFFGLLPAALGGSDLRGLLDSGITAMDACRGGGRENPALVLGGLLGAFALAGKDKATFVLSPEIAPFGAWLEQLIAESTGKEGRGILPVAGEPLGPPDAYGRDRLFIAIRLKWEGAYGPALTRLAARGHPVVSMEIGDLRQLGGQFYLWEMATAVAGHILGINPFDQPDVETAKKRARAMVARYLETRTLPVEAPVFEEGSLRVYGERGGASPGEILTSFFEKTEEDGYIAVQAYLDPCGETERALGGLRKRVFERFGKATSVGYGPRYLHSTGQLFKGDGGKGVFLQLTADAAEEAAIPDEDDLNRSSVTFGVLKAAQALGDREALRDLGRPVLSIHLGKHPVESLERITGDIL